MFSFSKLIKFAFFHKSVIMKNYPDNCTFNRPFDNQLFILLERLLQQPVTFQGQPVEI